MPKTRWLSLIGVGDDGPRQLRGAARAALAGAELIFGGRRHLRHLAASAEQLGAARAERIVWPSPFSAGVQRLLSSRPRRCAVLASGDPLCYGVGNRLLREPSIDIDDMTIFPAPSAFSLARARLGWDAADTETLSLHGRPAALLHAYLQPGLKLLLLTDDGAAPAAVAARLCRRGYGASELTVLEHLGGSAERLRRASAAAVAASGERFADLNTLAIRCVADADVTPLPRTPGLPDDAFRHDGRITKREVRAVTLARLAPLPGQRLWDVGAGAGSVAIEWLRAARGGSAAAIEQRPQRAAQCLANAEALGAPQLELIEGEAPAALLHLAAPDAVFIGGGIGSAGLVDVCWQRLRPGGRLVANAVTVQSEAALLAAHDRLGGELVRLQVARAEPVGGFLGWRPLMPVTQWVIHK